jgi:hypothetical protein
VFGERRAEDMLGPSSGEIERVAIYIVTSLGIHDYVEADKRM